MKAIVFNEIGAPADVLYLSEMPMPEIKENEVLIKMVSASINPGDFLFIQNLYPEPKKPVFPAQRGGNHGCGVIKKTGRNVKIKPGTFVAFSYYNTWAEYVVVPEEWLIALPSAYPPDKAGQFVNLITAWDLLHASKVKKGQWLALTSGYSAVSLMVTQFAMKKGINVISIVRKQKEDPDDKHTGTAAIIDLSAIDGTVKDKIVEITGGAGINAIIDNVGGPLLAELVRSAAFGSQVIINGGMSQESFLLHNFDILLNGIEIKSHVYRYFFNPPVPEDQPTLQEIIELSEDPCFYVHTGGRHSLEELENAIWESTYNPSAGKRHFIF